MSKAAPVTLVVTLLVALGFVFWRLLPVLPVIYQTLPPGAPLQFDGVTYTVLGSGVSEDSPIDGSVIVYYDIQVDGITDPENTICFMYLTSEDGVQWEPQGGNTDNLPVWCNYELDVATQQLRSYYKVPESMLDDVVGLRLETDRGPGVRLIR